MPVHGDDCRALAAHAIRDRHLLDPGEAVLCAVSGGADSLCLLLTLRELGYRVEVAHLDHQTRGGESRADAEFVESLARQIGVPCHVRSQPVEAQARSAGQPFEAFARAQRYAFLEAVAAERGIRAIATGHHADDQAETVLLRLLRGTGPQGLAGIPYIRWSGRFRIVRPLLHVHRAQIEAYLAERGVVARVDGSNSDTRFTRNRVRHELLPHLAEVYNPNIRGALVRLSELMRDDDELLQHTARAFLRGSRRQDGSIARFTYSEGPVALQRRALVLVAWELGLECEFELIERARQFIIQGAAGARFDMGGGVQLRNSRHATDFLTPEAFAEETPLRLKVPGNGTAFGMSVRIQPLERLPETPLDRYCTPLRQVVDGGALGKTVWVRRRKPGDRIQPLGMTGSKKLKDWFIDHGVSARQRDLAVVVESRRKVVWVAGHVLSAHAAVGPETRSFYLIELSNACD